MSDPGRFPALELLLTLAVLAVGGCIGYIVRCLTHG